MSKFRVGDKVTPVNVDRYTDRNSDRRKEMLGRTLVVRSVHNDEFTSVVFAGFPGEGVWQWRPDDLRLVSEAQMPERSKLLTVNLGGHGFLNPYADTSPTEPTDPAPAAAKKPIRRGDLVKYQGKIFLVISKGADPEGDYTIASLTGEPDFNWVKNWAKIDELTRIGSIRKKVKRLKAAIAKAGGEV